MIQRVGALSLFALGVNGIVGVGIFFTPNLLAALVPGAASALPFLGTAALLLPIAVTYALLGRSLTVDGGPYVWAEAAFGDGAAFAVGWVAAVSALLSTAAVLAGLCDNLAGALWVPKGLLRMLVVWSFIGGLSALASFGLRPSAFIWDALTWIKLGPLLLLVTLLVLTPRAPEAIAAGPASRENWGRALLVAAFPLQGFEAIPVLAGSVRRARFALPVATVGSLLFAALLYAAIQTACLRALPDLAAHEAPLGAAAEALGGSSAGKLVAVGTSVSALGTLFGMVVVTPRYCAALGSEAGLGVWLGRHDENGVPRLALWLTAVLVGVLASVRALDSLFALSSAAVLAQYGMAIASLLWLALGKRRLSRWAALPGLFGLGAIALLVRAVRAEELWILAGAGLLGAVAALVRARARRVT